MRKLLCKIFGHDWRYNFSALSNKRICKICYAKSRLNLNTLFWEDIPIFELETRTDKELINKWF